MEEYYSGILFLTSNRVGNIDPAFKSRIHMSVFYSRLDMDATCKLYEVFIKRAKAEQERRNSFMFDIKKKEIFRFAKRHFRQMEKEGLATWNGRYEENYQHVICLRRFQTCSISLLTHHLQANTERVPSSHRACRVRKRANHPRKGESYPGNGTISSCGRELEAVRHIPADNFGGD